MRLMIGLVRRDRAGDNSAGTAGGE